MGWAIRKDMSVSTKIRGLPGRENFGLGSKDREATPMDSAVGYRAIDTFIQDIHSNMK